VSNYCPGVRDRGTAAISVMAPPWTSVDVTKRSRKLTILLLEGDRLLDPGSLQRGVRDDPEIDEQLTAPHAAGFQPAFVEPQQVAVGATGRALADLGNHGHDANELLGNLREGRTQGTGLAQAQGFV